MKTFCRLAGGLILILVLIPGQGKAQLFKRLKETVQEHVNDKTTEKAGNETDKKMDEILGNHKKQNEKTNGENQSGTVANGAVSSSDSKQTVKSYSNYDFVPGDTIIFESQLADEQVGEIPSQFTMGEGQADVQVEDGENVIHVPKGAGALLTPRMSKSNYMPVQFTVEFDFKNELYGIYHFSVDFGQRVYYSGGEDITPGMEFESDAIHWTLGDVNYPEGLHVGGDNRMQWHHVAIAINKTAGKVYIDQFRVANVNNLTGKPKNVTIHVDGFENSYLKNIRIAAGGINIYKQKTTPARIVMHGILFDVDKATLKPESMGSINEIFNLLKRDPSARFEIDGHTDNSGEAAHNLTLSQQRADAVKAQLESMGINASRLTTKGFGDTKPIGSNDTPEGKANNRRVEFIKI